MRAGASIVFVVGGCLLIRSARVAADDAPTPALGAEKQAPAALAVVTAITKVAMENAALPTRERRTGDALAELYVRKAAVAANGDVRAFLVGIVKAVDPTDTLAKFPLTAKSFKDLETADEARARRAVIGEPTLRGRNDRLLHFVVSAAITTLLGQGAASVAALAKELSDMKGAEGFSVGDLLADMAGIVFARRLADGEPAKNLAWIAESFTGAAVVPDDAGLPDSLTTTEFEKSYGTVTDPRFVKVRERITASIDALPYLRTAAAPSASDGRRDPRPTR